MPRYEIQHRYVRQDTYVCEAEDQIEVLALFESGELDCQSKTDFAPEVVKVWSIDNNGYFEDLLLVQDTPSSDLITRIKHFLELEKFPLDDNQRTYIASEIAIMVVD